MIFKMRSTGILVAVIISLSFIFLSACKNSPTEAELKESLWKRAETYWNKRLMDKDYKTTYDMEAEKETIPFSVYKNLVFNKGQIDYLSIKTKDVKIEKDRGVVDLTMKCRLAAVPKALDLSFKKDRWIFKSGEWMHILEKK